MWNYVYSQKNRNLFLGEWWLLSQNTWTRVRLLYKDSVGCLVYLLWNTYKCSLRNSWIHFLVKRLLSNWLIQKFPFKSLIGYSTESYVGHTASWLVQYTYKFSEKNVVKKWVQKIFRALKASNLEGFRALKPSNFEDFRTLKPSNLVVGF